MGEVTYVESKVVNVMTLGRCGMSPSEFEYKLVDTIIVADPTNRQKLAAGFPEYVAAVEAWRFGDLAERYNRRSEAVWQREMQGA